MDEAGDGERGKRKKQKEKDEDEKKKRIERGLTEVSPLAKVCDATFNVLCNWTVLPYILDAIKRDQLATIFWLLVYMGINAFQFFF